MSFFDKTSIKIGENVEPEETVKVTLFVGNGGHSKTKTMYYTKLKLVEGYVNVVNINPTYFEENEVYIWAWNSSGLNVWTQDYELRDGTLLFDAEEIGATGFLLALMPKGYVVSNINAWDDAVTKQSGDIDPSKGFYDASGF